MGSVPGTFCGRSGIDIGWILHDFLYCYKKGFHDMPSTVDRWKAIPQWLQPLSSYARRALWIQVVNFGPT